MNSLKRIQLIIFITSITGLIFTANASPSPKKTLQLSLSEIVNTKTLRPKGYDYFNRFEGVYLNNDALVFRGRSSRKDRGIYTTLNGNLTLIAHRGTLAPKEKRIKFIYFTDNINIDHRSPPKLLGKKIVFAARSYDRFGIYKFSNNKIEKMADTKTPIPGGAKGLFTKLSCPGFLGSDKIGFLGEGENFISGIYSATEKGKIKTLIDNKTKFPGGEGNFTDFRLLKLSNSNQNEDDFVFLGRGKKNQYGLFWNHGGKLVRILENGTEIPDGVGHFQHIHQIGFDAGNEQIALIGEGILGQAGIYLYRDKNIIKIVDQQTEIPHEEDKFNTFKSILLGGKILAFTAIGHKKQKGIYVYMPDGLFKIVSTRDKINKKPVKNVELGLGILDGNKIPIVITFRDGSSAIYIVKITTKEVKK